MSVFGSNSLVLESLRDRAYGLKDLHSDFISTFGGRIHVVNFFEERKTCLLKFGLFRWEDYVSACLPAYTQILLHFLTRLH